MDILDTLARLSRVGSVHGREEATASLLQELWKDWVDESHISTLGNYVGLARGSGAEPRPRVAAAAHMDCIGFMVTKIEEGGFLRLTRVGGVDRRLLLGQEVEVRGKRSLFGVIGSKPPHISAVDERKKVVPIEELYVDLGLADDEVRSLVRPGDAVLYHQDVIALRNGRAAGRYLDDIAGLAVLGMALEELHGSEHGADFLAVGTVGEEAGFYPGAATAAFDLRPNMAVAVDVTFGSYPGQADPTSTFPLGDGPTVGVGPNCHPMIAQLMKDAAAEAGINVHTDVIPAQSGTDAWGMQTVRGGIPTEVLSVPLRYMHTPVETVSLNDIRDAGRLLALITRRVDWAFVEGLSCLK